MATVLALIALGSGSYLLYRVYREIDTSILLYALFPAFVLVIHSLGFLNAKYLLSTIEYNYVLADAQIDENDISLAFVWVIVGSLFAYFVGYLFRGIFSIEKARLKSLTDRMILDRKFKIFCGIIFALEIHLLVSGGFAIGGVTNSLESKQVSPIAQLLPPVVNIMLYLAGYMAKQRSGRPVALVLLCSQLFFAFIGGRRALFIGLVSLLLGLQMSGSLLTRLSLRQRILAVLCVVLVFSIGFPFYQAIRSQKLEGASAFQNISWAFSQGYKRVFHQTSGEEDFKDNSRYNALTRAFYIGYPAMMFKHGQDQSGANGLVVLEALKIAIPRIIWPTKGYFVDDEMSSEKYIAYSTFRLPRFTDESTTIFETGFTEFKYPGIFIYIFLVYALSGWILFSALRSNVPLMALYAIFSEVYLFMTIEFGIVDWIILLRNTSALLVLAIGFKLLFSPPQHSLARPRRFGPGLRMPSRPARQ